MTVALAETELHARVTREQICVVTGEVLDPLTAISVYEPSGEILVAVLSPNGWHKARQGILRRVPAAIIVQPQRATETLSAETLDTEQSVMHS